MKFNKLNVTLSGTSNKIDGYASSQSFNTNPMPIHGVYGYSFQISWPATGSPVGVFQAQHSDDYEFNSMMPDSSVATWTNVTGATVSPATVAGNGIIEVFSASRWVRLTYTVTSGTGTFTIRSHIKSMF
jgi:hypothetical protein